VLIYTILLMAGDGSVANPRQATSIFPALDQWAILVRDSFTCNDRTGTEIPGRKAILPTSWSLVRDLGTIGLCSLELSDEVRLGALAKFGYGDTTAVVGRDLAELRNRATLRRAEAIAALPQAVQDALAGGNAKAKVRAWLVAQSPANPNVVDFRDWLVAAIDDLPTNSLPEFLYDRAHRGSINWAAAANLADFIETSATATQKLVLRIGEIVFLTIFLEKTA